MRTHWRSIEPGATALAALNATAQDLADIEKHYLKMKEGANNKARQLFNNHDLLFHRALLKASHNSFMIALGDLLSSVMLVAFDATLEEELSPHNVALQEHFNVFESVRLRKPEEAREQMRNIVLCSIEKQLKQANFTEFLI
ncbi:FCD domain-containing protein [Aliiglaciecola sp. 3_MG-2023]|uniref:FadR/GntR family transcriptional regulator n=1 Tax=Aliiglaciecola sp. 3_MG-2023 TaxID=3062644 RepID=UPI0026E2B38C|nr:FCD domain-containing protein [Aliiglaciecola sp. 3_MG-2023]MDO6693898.1 FCD domain-containing protein [Aliiglaciecola sp. 3_MG-2023]